MSGGMIVDLVTGDGYVIVSLSGELDLAEAPVIRKALDRLVQSSTRLIVVDAAELTFLDSSGIGVLVAARNQQAERGGLLVIANLSELTGRPVRLTEVDTAIPVHWADGKTQPWAKTHTTTESILADLGFANVADTLTDELDISAESIG